MVGPLGSSCVNGVIEPFGPGAGNLHIYIHIIYMIIFQAVFDFVFTSSSGKLLSLLFFPKILRVNVVSTKKVIFFKEMFPLSWMTYYRL